MQNSPENYDKVRAFLDKVIAKRDAGTLTFSEAFPRASEHKRRLFARMESRSLVGSKPNMLFGAYAKRWCDDLLAQDPSITKQRDHKRILQSRILPYFKDMSFAEINGVEIKRYILQLRHKSGPKAGQQLVDEVG